MITQQLVDKWERVFHWFTMLTIVVGLIHAAIARIYIRQLEGSVRTLQAVCIDGGGR